MDSSRGTTSYRGHDRHDWNHHVDDSPQHSPSSVHMLEENVPLHDQPGLTDSRRYPDLERTGSSLRGLGNINHDCPWQPGRSRRILYLGYAPLLLSLACTLLAIYVIFNSQGQLVSEWDGSNRMQPGQLLAFTSTAANSLMMLAYVQGWVSFFWIQALKGNMPVSNLHYNWEAATSLWGSLKSLMRKRARRVSIVSILVATTSFLRGPLIQKGSYIQTINSELQGTIGLQVLPTTEVWESQSFDTPKFKRMFSDVMREYQARTPIYIPGSDCNNCSLSVKGFGFRYVNTANQSNLHNFLERPSPNKYGTYTVDRIFNVTASASNDNKYIEVDILRKASYDCVANLISTTYHLYPSTVEYELSLHGQKATFRTSDWRNDSVYRGATSFLYEQNSNNQSACGPSFDDPTNDILNGFRELALRLSIREAIGRREAAAAAGNVTEDNPAFVQKVDYTSHQLRTEYAVNKPALALAVVVSLLGPISILSLFKGWTTLGRDFSLSPFELANSFLLRSPLPSSSPRSNSSGDSISELKQRQHQLASLLASCSSNASAEKVLESICQRAEAASDGVSGTTTKEPVVQYGVLDGTGLLGFAISDVNGVVHARKPREGEIL
ncbi:hypothetical protein NEUTE1DRAFT_45681 [Neurospora tetrasperma FGSC 2508]|uniref:Uncharacterized protein n=1 Tax=Neurospora tetrasperma (strain FGSC 2508 / ATCC MYA-4615 / P0657) TaxID=510951 RepID=F8MQY4_NEUT8|nr:uncharacterized protein NEUTE1DRAFT_45681 [Neurospora tetrasperma FGSC 2508]EGO56764.1 hypothetical protein NEUTE1DRAFT_45681 [Neurospora tetrasperma FGSC 2508]EGZ70351.1 hypothetical protein NEUTE2DRAFT_68785 [Neurospora tetrasperma FGSC 2509]